MEVGDRCRYRAWRGSHDLVLIVPWTVFFVLFLFVTAIVGGRLTRRIVAQLALITTIVALSVPCALAHVSQYGAWSLTSQGGIHFAYWIVPLVKEARDGTPWPVTYEQMQKEMSQRYPSESDNPFEQSRRFETFARESLAKLGPIAIAKAWFFGAVINLASPAVILSPIVASLPWTGFYATPGTSMPDKIFNFLFHSDNALYAWILLFGIVGLTVMRLMQLIGLSSLAGDANNRAIFCCFSFGFFILAVSGPIASQNIACRLSLSSWCLQAPDFSGWAFGHASKRELDG